MTTACLWGVFDGDTEVHVMPCDAAGIACWPHVAHPTCPCEPLVDVGTLLDGARTLWTHNR